MKKIFIFTLPLFFAFSCSTTIETKLIDLDNLKSEIINNSKEFQLAYINNEYSNAKKFLSDNIITSIFNSNGSPLVIQAEEEISNSGRGWSFSKFEMTNHQVFISPDATGITVVFDTDGEIEIENSEERVPYSTRASQFWVSTPNGWKIMHSHWSPKSEAQGIPNE